MDLCACNEDGESDNEDYHIIWYLVIWVCDACNEDGESDNEERRGEFTDNSASTTAPACWGSKHKIYFHMWIIVRNSFGDDAQNNAMIMIHHCSIQFKSHSVHWLVQTLQKIQDECQSDFNAHTYWYLWCLAFSPPSPPPEEDHSYKTVKVPIMMMIID